MRLAARVLVLSAVISVASIAMAPYASGGREAATGAPAAGATATAQVVADGTFSFLSRDDRGAPLRFDPCRPVRYTINPAGAPSGTIDDVHEAFRRLGAATGITFDYVGATTETHFRIGSSERSSYQPARYGADQWAPILVSFATERDEPILAGNVLGYGGSTSYWTESSDPAYVTGEIVLDRDLSLVRPGFGAGMSRGNLVQHELAHVIGLDHVDDRGEIMFASISDQSPDGYGSGDREGLRQLGVAAGCLAIATP